MLFKVMDLFSDPIAAPINDIKLLKKLVDYTQFNKTIKEVAIKKFINHL
jgi:hypothetical protein